MNIYSSPIRWFPAFFSSLLNCSFSQCLGYFLFFLAFLPIHSSQPILSNLFFVVHVYLIFTFGLWFPLLFQAWITLLLMEATVFTLIRLDQPWLPYQANPAVKGALLFIYFRKIFWLWFNLLTIHLPADPSSEFGFFYRYAIIQFFSGSPLTKIRPSWSDLYAKAWSDFSPF